MGAFMGLFQVDNSVIMDWKVDRHDIVMTDLAVEYRPTPSHTHHDYTGDSDRHER